MPPRRGFPAVAAVSSIFRLTGNKQLRLSVLARRVPSIPLPFVRRWPGLGRPGWRERGAPGQVRQNSRSVSRSSVWV
jgi:hypothetical protein